MDLIDLLSIFRDKSVQLFIQNYFKNCELTIICYNLLGAPYLNSENLLLILISKSIVNFPFLDGDVPRSTSYGVYISQLIRFL